MGFLDELRAERQRIQQGETPGDRGKRIRKALFGAGLVDPLELYQELPRLGTQVGAGARWVGELPSKILFGEEEFEKLKELQGPERMRKPEEELPPAETPLQQAIDVVGPAVAPTLATLPLGGGARIGGRAARAVFDAVVEGAMGYAVAPEGKGLQTAATSAVLGPALGQLGKFDIPGTAAFQRQFTQAGRPAARRAARETMERLVREARPTATPQTITPPAPEPAKLLADKITESYKGRAFKGETKEFDKALRSLWEEGGEALPDTPAARKVQRALQDNMIRSLPADARMRVGKQWSNFSEAREAAIAKIPPVHREGIRQFALQQTEMAKDYALRADVQRDEIFKFMASAIEETGQSKLIKTKELEDLKHVLTRLPGDVLEEMRHSLGGMDANGRSRLVNLLNGVRCLSPCVPIAEILQRPGGSSLIREIRMSGMLTGLGTWARNIFGTGSRITINPLRTAIAGGLDVAKAKALGLPRERYAEEVFGELAGYWQGLKAALGRRRFQSDVPEDLVDFGLRTRAIREFGHKPPSAIGEALRGKVGTVAGRDVGEAVGKITSFPFRALNAQDEFMFTMAYSGELYRGAHRQALKEGLGGKKAFERINQIINQQAHALKDLHKQAMLKAEKDFAKRLARSENPLSIENLAISEWRKLVDEVQPNVAQARQMAEKAIFIAREGKKLDQAIDALDAWDNKMHGLVSIPLPFRRTPANVMRETIRSSPAGLVSPVAELAKGGKEAATGEMMDRLGQAFAGTAMLYGLWSMVKSGLIEAEPFGREKGRADRLTKELAGVGQDSVRVGNWSIPIDRIEPIGTMVLAAARADELQKSGDIESAAGELSTVAWELTRQSVNSTFLDGIVQFMTAAQGEERTAKKFAQRLGGSFVPAAVRDVRRALGAPLEEVEAAEGPAQPISLAKEFGKGFLGALGVGERAKLGTFGKEREPGALFTGARGEGNPLAQELIEIDAPIDIPALPTGVDKSRYDSNERETFIKAKGQMQEYALRRLMASPAYSTLPPERKKLLVKQVINKVNRRINARAALLKKRNLKWTTRDLLRGFIRTGG